MNDRPRPPLRLVHSAKPLTPDTPPRARSGRRVPYQQALFSAEEEAKLRAALRNARTTFGSWRALSAAMRVPVEALEDSLRGRHRVSGAIAISLSAVPRPRHAARGAPPRAGGRLYLPHVRGEAGAMKRRRPNPIAEVFVSEGKVLRLVARDLHVPYRHHEDFMQDVLVIALDCLARGLFVVPDNPADIRPHVRGYLRTIAWRFWRDTRDRRHVDRELREPAEQFDPMPRYEARSELRALDLSPTALAFWQLIAHEESVPRVARRLNLPAGTVYTRIRPLRADARAARRRLK